jgi:hypothetical protein
VSVRYWPLGEGDRCAWLMLVSVIVTLFVASLATQSLPTGLVLAALLAIGAWQLWLPTRCDFSAAGIALKVLGRSRRIAWNEMARIESRPAGLLLQLRADAPAIYVPFQHHKQEVLAQCEFYFGTPQSASASGGGGASG